MFNTQITSLLLSATLLVLSGCSWMFKKPLPPLDSELHAVMQKPVEAGSAETTNQQFPLRVHYELKQKPLRDEKLLITLEIIPDEDVVNSAFSIKAPEAITLVEPLEVINLGSLTAHETYTEEVWLKPVNEGLYDIEVYIIAQIKERDPVIKNIRIPISIGPFERQTGR